MSDITVGYPELTIKDAQKLFDFETELLHRSGYSSFTVNKLHEILLKIQEGKTMQEAIEFAERDS